MTTIILKTMLAMSSVNVNDKLLDAIEHVESSHQQNPKGWNDGGKAKSWFQCHEDYWQDGCRFLGVNWPWSDAYDRDKSRKIVRAYLEGYGRVYTKQTGKLPTDKVYAMIHHFGPSGWKRTDESYWKKVMPLIK